MSASESNTERPGAPNQKTATIFVVEDDPHDRVSLEVHLKRGGYNVRTFGNGESFLAAVSQEPADLVLLDIVMPGIGGLETLSHFNQLQPDTPVILLTGHGTVENAFQAMQLGAYDFIPKPYEMARLSVSIHNALRTKDLTREVKKLQGEIRGHFDFKNLIGISPTIARVFADLERLADSDLPVLIQGEPGTGKELVARTLHYNSRRGEGPFVYVNCSNINPNLLEAELFGATAGSGQSGSRHPGGKWGRADGGTLFLDDVSEMPLPVQSKLLDHLREREAVPTGTSPPAKDVRIICSTRTELNEEVQRGHFSAELVNRLAPFRVMLPPLRDRVGDVPVLTKRFLSEVAEQEHRPEPRLSEDAKLTLEAYNWPGNVRELKNVIRQVFMLSTAAVIQLEDLPPSIQEAAKRREIEAEISEPERAPVVPLKEVEERLIRQTLAQTGGDVNRSASLLGISRATLYRRLKTLQIPREKS